MYVERSSTRLWAPPGGKSSFSLAHDEGPGAVKKAEQLQQQQATKAATATAQAQVQAQLPAPGTENLAAAGSSRAAVNQTNGSGMASLISQSTEQPRAAGRVRAPPGGASSIIFG